MSDDDEEMEAAAGPAQRNMPANRGIITPDQVRITPPIVYTRVLLLGRPDKEYTLPYSLVGHFGPIMRRLCIRI